MRVPYALALCPGLAVLFPCLVTLVSFLMLGGQYTAAQSPTPPTGQLLVFAASSLTEPLQAIGKRLENKYPGLSVVYNFGASSTLRTQLEQGAQADLFASADVAQMALAQQHKVVQEAGQVFAKNRLVVLVPQTSAGKITTFRDLATPGITLALTHPQVPIGAYSRQALRLASADYGADFAANVLRNLVSEEDNVKQVVTKVVLGEVDAGMVYLSDVTPQVRAAVVAIPIPEAYNQLAMYPIARTAAQRNPTASEAFLSLLFSTEGQAILQAHHLIPLRD